MEMALSEVSDYLLRRIRHSVRIQISRQTLMPRETDEGDAERIKRNNSRFLKLNLADYFSWPLMDGSFLGDADKEKLLENAERSKKNADGNRVNEVFYTRIASKMRKNQKVRRVWKLEELRKLRSEVEEEVNAGRHC